MTAIDTASLGVSLAILILSVISQTFFWQIKEYRLDRMRSHLLSPEGSLKRHPFALLAMAAIFTGWLAYLLNTASIPETAGYTALAAFLVHHLNRIRVRGLFRPVFTAKAVVIMVSAFLLTLIYYWLVFVPGIFTSLQHATAVFFLPAFAALAVALVNIPFALYKQTIINRARQLRQSLPNLTVIGITGSYGKTTAKHGIEHMLKNLGKNVVATREHHNTPIGVAQDMLALLKPDTEYFVAELSAYRRGEIKELVGLVKPKIGIITAFGTQHLDLFGSRANIRKAKMELIENLPADGVAIIEPKGVLNAVANALGISKKDMRTAIKSLRVLPRTLEEKIGQAGALIIDDSYSANEHGVLHALDYLKQQTQSDKRMVFLPIIELGRESKAIHKRIGDAIQAAGIKLYVAGTWYQRELGPGFYTNNPKRLAVEVAKNLDNNTAVLIEGRVPEIVRDSLIPRK